MIIITALLTIIFLMSSSAIMVAIVVSKRVWGFDIHREPIWFKNMMNKISAAFIISTTALIIGGILAWLELLNWHW